MNKHTPTPWNICDSTPSMIEAGDEIIAQSLEVDGDVRHQTKWATAAHIVRCVNSHEALVKALEDCVRVFENELSGLTMIGPELRQARAALAAAGAPQ